MPARPKNVISPTSRAVIGRRGLWGIRKACMLRCTTKAGRNLDICPAPRLMTNAISIAAAVICLAGCHHSADQLHRVGPISTFVPGFQFRGEARLQGMVGLKATCIVIIDDDGHAFVPIWSAEAELDRDDQGWFVRDRLSGEILRPGDHAVGAGGILVDPNGVGWSRADVDAVAAPDVPEECGPGIVSFHSFRRQNRAD